MAKKKTQSISDAAVIYSRYSSHAQKDISIEQQVEACMKYAKDNTLHVVEVYPDRAISGRSDNRPNFQRMMRDAEKGKFRYVIAWKSNRMGRNMLQAMMNEAKLSEIGIRVLYVEEDFDDSAAGRFALRSMMNVNQFYSENMAEDIKRGMYDNAANCKITNGHLPFGYKKGEDGRYALDEPKDAVVREIFSRVACGEMFVDIANDLNRRGIKTSRGGEWNKNSFHALTTNERYTGVYIYGDVRIEGGVPKIVGKDLFWRVQKILKTKKNPQGRHRSEGDYLLTGKLYCGKCKSHMVGLSGTGKSGKLHYYYVCQKKRTDKSCDKTAVRRDWIEQEVASAIREHILKDDVIAWIADSAVAYSTHARDMSNLSILEDQLAENKRATKNLLAAIEQGIITPTTKERLIELETEQANVTAKVAVEKSEVPEVTREDVVMWMETFRNGDVADKTVQTKLFDAFLAAAYLYDNDLRIVFGFSGAKNTISIPIGELDDLGAERSGDGCEGSYKLSYGSPKESQANPDAAIYMVGGVFVLVCTLSHISANK